MNCCRSTPPPSAAHPALPQPAPPYKKSGGGGNSSLQKVQLAEAKTLAGGGVLRGLPLVLAVLTRNQHNA